MVGKRSRATNSATEVGTRVARTVAGGFALYVVLGAAWLYLEWGKAYDRVVLVCGEWLLFALSHYPLGSESADPLKIHNQGFVLVLIASLAVVARGSWRDRLLRFGGLGGLVILSHVAGLALQLHVALALKFQQRTGVPLLLPWEMEIEKRIFQFLFLFGLQIAGFLAILFAAWSLWAPQSASRKGWQKRRVLAGLALSAALLTLLAGIAWHVRERDPRHARVHAVLGDAFLTSDRAVEAEAQLRAALRGGSRDGRVWLGLIRLVRERGDEAEARILKQRALEAVSDPGWRPQLAAEP